MTLQNLLKIGRLKRHAPTPQEIQRLLAAAERNLTDARNESISDETRFDVAYKAIMQLALAATLDRDAIPNGGGNSHQPLAHFAFHDCRGPSPKRLRNASAWMAGCQTSSASKVLEVS